MRARNTPVTRGFTVVEVLVALAIFGMASVVLGSAYINILNAYDITSRANGVNADVEFARSIVLREPDREKLERGGEFQNTESRAVRWAVKIEPTNMPDLFSVVFTCELSGVNGRQPEKHEETFVVLRPTWSTDTGEQGRLREEAKRRILEIQQELAAR